MVCFVVAADEGRRSSPAIIATRSRRWVSGMASSLSPAPTARRSVGEARAELAETGLRDAAGVTVSAVDGTGLAELRAALDLVLAAVPEPAITARVRLWVDRSFTITGAGTVATGTLAAGTLAGGDRLELLGAERVRSAVVRGLQSRGEPYATLGPVSRVAVNLRGVSRDAVRRGDAVVTPDAWPSTDTLDVRRTTGGPLTEVPAQLVVHVGTAAVPARLRPFDADHARLTLDHSCRWFSATGWYCAIPAVAECSGAPRCSTPIRRYCAGAGTARAGRRRWPAWTLAATCTSRSLGGGRCRNPTCAD